MNSPRTLWLAAASLILLVSATLTSCSVNSDGPIGIGASHGSLGSTDMADYYYKKQAGWTYVFRNQQLINNSDGSVTTYTGANDTVRSLGYCGLTAPNGDSLFKVSLTYRVLSTYAGRDEVDIRWIADNPHRQMSGAFIEPSCATVDGESSMYKRPRPVSTDTILAGVVGRIRTMCDDFTNQSSNEVWQTDTLWFTSTGDSVFIWERFPGMLTLSKSRLIFCRDFTNANSNNWMYDLIYNSTYIRCKDANDQVTVPYGTFPHVAKFEVYTPSITDNMPIKEYKWYACGTGPIKQHDTFWVTSDGTNRVQQEFKRELISLTHN